MRYPTDAAICILVLSALGCGGSGIDKKPTGPANDDEPIVVVDMDEGEDTDPTDEPADLNAPEEHPVCGDGVVEGDEECDGTAGKTCAELGFDGGTVACGSCVLDTSACTRASCGDGVVQDAETCDDGSANGSYDACNSNCSGLTAFCGDGAVDGPEECDGANLAGATCRDLGFDGGELSCSSTCGLDTSGCSSCGNGVVEDGEACDDGAANGRYGKCNASCTGLGEHCGDGVRNGNEECDGSDVGFATCASEGGGRGEIGCTSSCSFDLSVCSVVPAGGELVISEIMQNPDLSYDNDGEWFELYNPTTRTFDLQGCTVESGTSSGPESFEITEPLPIAPDGYITLARSSAAPFAADYVYGFAMNLNNSTDYVELSCPDPFDPDSLAVVDRVDYDDGATFPDPTGASMTLSPFAMHVDLNDDGANWCEASSTFGVGDLGTPGAPNDSCP